LSQKKSLALVVQPQEYFHDLVTQALSNQKVRTKPEAEFYLVNLLNQFMHTERLYQKDGEGHLQNDALALMFKDALELQRAEEQRAMFRHVGDVSLYVAGFFQDSLSRRLVDVDYYINMGENAYKHVANRVNEMLMRALYQELAEKFASFVEVLAEVSDKTGGKTEKDILRIYELWLKTKSERAAKALKEAGILPNDTIKKNMQ
jgi:hypothetical protein